MWDKVQPNMETIFKETSKNYEKKYNYAAW